MRQREAILLDSLDLVQARNCQVRLTHALAKSRLILKAEDRPRKQYIFWQTHQDDESVSVRPDNILIPTERTSNKVYWWQNPFEAGSLGARMILSSNPVSRLYCQPRFSCSECRIFKYLRPRGLDFQMCVIELWVQSSSACV